MIAETLATFTDANFDAEVVRSSQPVLVDFWATWCGPCRALAPVVETLAREYAGRVKFGKLNVDESQRVAAQLEVRSVPTLLLFKDGRVIGQIVGAAAKPRIDALVQKSLRPA
jgi:thioredoxin 1